MIKARIWSGALALVALVLIALAARKVISLLELTKRHLAWSAVAVYIEVLWVMTLANAFANQLDEAVHHAVDGLLNEAIFQRASVQAYRERLANPHTVSAWKRWPCLSRELGVELQLNRQRA